jgi:hypothetical protein
VEGRMKNVIAMLLMVATVSIVFAETQKWYKLEKGESYVADFLLKGGGSQKVTIDSTKSIKVGFRTDLYYAPKRSELYKEFSAKYKSKVIKLIDIKSGNSISTVWAASGRFVPVGNKVIVEVVNLTDNDFKVLIYQKSDSD